jgi:hypothetical protein
MRPHRRLGGGLILALASCSDLDDRFQGLAGFERSRQEPKSMAGLRAAA